MTLLANIIVRKKFLLLACSAERSEVQYVGAQPHHHSQARPQYPVQSQGLRDAGSGASCDPPQSPSKLLLTRPVLVDCLFKLYMNFICVDFVKLLD